MRYSPRVRVSSTERIVKNWLNFVGGSSASSPIKSIQRGTITISNGNTSNTATITSVDTTLAYVVYLGITTADAAAEPDRDWARLTLTNATTVTATRAGSINALTISFEVVEFNTGFLTSLQTGTITIGTGNTTGTATITAVTTTKAIVIFAGFTSTQTDQTNQTNKSWTRLDLTNSTTVTATRNTSDAGFTVTAGFTVVEFI